MSDNVERWRTLHDDLLRGVAHAMSNRIASLSAVAFMLSETGAASARTSAALQSDVEQLEALLVQLRLLTRGDGAPEPLIVHDTVRTAIALHEHHTNLRDVPCTLGESGSDTPPAHAEPQALLHAMLIAISAAKEADASGVVVRITADDDVVSIVASAAGADIVPDSRWEAEALAAASLLNDSNGRAWSHRGGIVVEIPTLVAARRARSG